jgi:ubiquinone/menaquinone biosynthesis C-methylase UbiE
MIENGSYQIQAISDSVQLEVGRLQAQVNLFWKPESQKYRDYGLVNGMAIAEFGSGPGFLSKKLLDAFPDLTMTAIELDAELIAFAQRNLPESLRERVSYVRKSVVHTELPSNSFDCVIVRLLLEHLPDPMQCIQEALRILKPGGRIVCIDNDFSNHLSAYPKVESLATLYEAYCEARKREGGHPEIGKMLPSLLSRAGFSLIDFDIICAHSVIVGEDMFRQSEGLGIAYRLVKDGFLTSKDLSAIVSQWREMLGEKCHGIIRQLYMAAGTKLGEGNAN